MDWEVVEGGWWRRTTEMPAVPINHSLPVIDSANVVWGGKKKGRGSWMESIEALEKTSQTSQP